MAFSLLELLVAISLLALLVTVLFSISNGMMQMSQAATMQTQRLERAGTALDFLRRDLSDAMLPIDPLDTGSLQFLLNPPLEQVPEAYRHPSSAFWQALERADNAKGNLATVGYFIRWETSVPGHPRPILCRLHLNADDPDNLVFSGDPWLSEALLNTKAAGTVASEFSGYVTDGVIALWMRAFDASGQPLNTWDSRTQPAGLLPQAVEVAIVVLDSRTLERLTTIPISQQVNAEKFDEEVNAFVNALPREVQEGARVFSTMIYLNNARRTP